MRIRYDREQIFEVFKAAYAFNLEIDPEVEPDLVISYDMSYQDWIHANDLIPKSNVQLEALKREYNSKMPMEAFQRLWDSKKTTLGNVIDLIAEYAEPIFIPNFRFGGAVCESGTILRHLVRSMQKRAPKGMKITPRTRLSDLLRFRDLTPLGEIAGLMPDLLPPPKRISHWGLLPKFIKIRITAYYLCLFGGIGYGLYALLWGVKLHAAIILCCLLGLALIVKLDRSARPASHWILPGAPNLRQLVKEEGDKAAPVWRRLRLS